jgi:hypothetical protein
MTFHLDVVECMYDSVLHGLCFVIAQEVFLPFLTLRPAIQPTLAIAFSQMDFMAL